MKIDFFKQDKINQPYKKDLYFAIENIIDGNSPIVLGDYSKIFEDLFAKYVESKYCAFVSNGIDALSIALKVINVKQDDEILVPNHTFIATWLSAINLGCIIVPVPVKEDSLLIDENQIENYITPKTKVIIPVHIYGNPTNTNKIKKIAEDNNLFVIDDAAQAHGAEIENKKIGNLFDMSCFSFYPTKSLGALGEAGCITTNNLDFYKKINSIKNCGKSLDNSSLMLHQGSNYRGDELQAAFLISKLKNLENIVQKRKDILKTYKKLENINTKGKLKLLSYSNSSAPYLAVIRLKNLNLRNSLIKYLKNKNIQTMIHYEIPCHKQKFIKKNQVRISKKSASQASEISETILSLPMSEVHSKEEINYVIDCINEFFQN